LETDRWSQTQVNSIRRATRASLLAKGEACRDSGEPVTVQVLLELETGRVVAWLEWERREEGMEQVERPARGTDRRRSQRVHSSATLQSPGAMRSETG